MRSMDIATNGATFKYSDLKHVVIQKDVVIKQLRDQLKERTLSGQARVAANLETFFFSGAGH